MNILITKKFVKDVAKELTKSEKDSLAQLLIDITSAKALNDIIDCKKLKGFKNAYRIKFGNFHIGFIWEDETIKLSRMLNRKDVYKYFP